MPVAGLEVFKNFDNWGGGVMPTEFIGLGFAKFWITLMSFFVGNFYHFLTEVGFVGGIYK